MRVGVDIFVGSEDYSIGKFYLFSSAFAINNRPMLFLSTLKLIIVIVARVVLIKVERPATKQRPAASRFFLSTPSPSVLL